MRPSLPTALAAGLIALALLGACREDPGPNPYADQEDFLDDAEDVFLPGPDPYEGFEPRLDLGLFYEGGSSERITIDGVSRHYYIYSNEATSIETYAQEVDDDRLEGFVSDRIVLSGNPWWGGGVHWDAPGDLSRWGTLHVSLKSDDPSFEALLLAMESADGGVGAVAVADYRYFSDGSWHSLEIPLATFAAQGVDLTQVSIALRFDGTGGDAGASILVDDLYLTP